MTFEFKDNTRHRRLLLITIGGVLAASAGVAAFTMASNGRPAEVEKQAVLVAGREVGARTAISNDDLTMRDVPVDQVLGEAYTNPEQVVGRITSVPILPGQQITPNLFATSNANSDFSILGPGETVSDTSPAFARRGSRSAARTRRRRRDQGRRSRRPLRQRRDRRPDPGRRRQLHQDRYGQRAGLPERRVDQDHVPGSRGSQVEPRTTTCTCSRSTCTRPSRSPTSSSWRPTRSPCAAARRGHPRRRYVAVRHHDRSTDHDLPLPGAAADRPQPAPRPVDQPAAGRVSGPRRHLRWLAAALLVTERQLVARSVGRTNRNANAIGQRGRSASMNSSLRRSISRGVESVRHGASRKRASGVTLVEFAIVLPCSSRRSSR